MTIKTFCPDRSTARACIMLAGASLLFSGCLMRQNDALEVGGVVPSALREQPTEIGRPTDTVSVTSLGRGNWGESDFLVASDSVAHRPTYARRNTRFEVSARASGQYPTLAEAMNMPGGPSESEQIYDAVTWPILIMPAAFLVPVGLFFEPWIAVINQSPHWEYERSAQGRSPAERRGATGDPLVDRLGMPVVNREGQVLAPVDQPGEPVVPTDAPTVAPSMAPYPIVPEGIAPATPTAVPTTVEPGSPPADLPTGQPTGEPATAPGAAPAGGTR